MPPRRYEFGSELLDSGPLGYDALASPVNTEDNGESISFLPNSHYEQYLQMHKVIVGQQGAQKLESIHESLANETLPRYLSAAGWAATEAALIQADKPLSERQALLDEGLACWERALEKQKTLNGGGPDCLVEHSYPHRIALDIAVMPLLKHMIKGEVPSDVRRSVFRDCLNIAQSNAVYIDLMAKDGHIEALNDYLGLGYECNALLAFNLRCSRGWFVVPSMARADSGYYYRQQTHDLLVVHHRNGQLLNTTPVEIKATATARDRERYKALIVRGKMHLSIQGGHKPQDTLRAIEAVFEDRATRQEENTVGEVSSRMVEMVRDYCAGEVLGHIATARSVTRFRDNRQVVAKHAGLASKVSA